LPNNDGSQYMTLAECKSHVNHFNDKLMNIGKDVERNAKGNEKILRILQGNGEGGLIWKVNALMMRNQWLDKAFSIVLSIASTLLTLWLTGVLKI